LVGFVEVDEVDEVEVLVVVGRVVVVTTELLLDELVLEVVVLEVLLEVKVLGFGVVDTGGSPAASTPTERLLVSSGLYKGDRRLRRQRFLSQNDIDVL
jgi:hypothetical protein